MRPITPFRFKQFSISHDKCAHKVGTDGLLLGAWVQAENPKSVLDVGTGSGLIALMMAQKFPHTQVSGIELDEPSFIQATENAEHSPFSDRTHILKGDFLKYAFAEKFDLIVSNPPFYKGNTSTGKSERDRARHEEHLPQKDFLEKAISILAPAGKLAVILPNEEGEQFEKEAHNLGLNLNKLTKVLGSPSAPVKRWLLEFSFSTSQVETDEITLRDDEGNRSLAYQKLTQDFYL